MAQSCPTLCDPMNHSTPGLPVHHQLPEFTQNKRLECFKVLEQDNESTARWTLKGNLVLGWLMGDYAHLCLQIGAHWSEAPYLHTEIRTSRLSFYWWLNFSGNTLWEYSSGMKLMRGWKKFYISKEHGKFYAVMFSRVNALGDGKVRT